MLGRKKTTMLAITRIYAGDISKQRLKMSMLFVNNFGVWMFAFPLKKQDLIKYTNFEYFRG